MRTRPTFPARRAAAVANLPEFEQLRDIGKETRRTLADLDSTSTPSPNVEQCALSCLTRRLANGFDAAGISRLAPDPIALRPRKDDQP